MFHDITSFVTYKKWNKEYMVYLGDDTIHAIAGQGDACISLNDGHVIKTKNVLYVSGI